METVPAISEGNSLMTRVTIYQSGKPQFYGEFDNPFDAEKYRAMWRGLAVKAGILIRIDLEEVQ